MKSYIYYWENIAGDLRFVLWLHSGHNFMPTTKAAIHDKDLI